MPESPDAYRLSAGVVVIQAGRPRRYLLLRAFQYWDFPKGMVEPGETPFEAAVREVAEETTLDDLAFDWGQQFMETGPYSRGKVARYYLAATGRADVELPVNPELGRPEHSEYRWVDYSQALALASPRLRPVVHWAARMIGIVHVAAPPSAPAD